jgi:DnaJ-class molecular chaperone
MNEQDWRQPLPQPSPKRIRCRRCNGFGLTSGRDAFGFGKPCPSCDGTGLSKRSRTSTGGRGAAGQT